MRSLGPIARRGGGFAWMLAAWRPAHARCAANISAGSIDGS
jgi:hypothetical protein